MLGALGVVFGDIGTSPLYTLQTVFDPSDPHPVAADRSAIFGIISLIFWAVTLIVTVTYVLLVMRADNGGEGGIMALITLIRRGAGARPAQTTLLLAALGIFGASLFFGDSMITPAISVLSAVEGLKVVEPTLNTAVVPIAAAILVCLFLLQRRGTATVGRLFGPVMLTWFAVIALVGVNGITAHPEILKALSPTYALSFFGHFGTAFFALAGVVLVVTGAEALYADMGHFGRAPITRSWLLVVFPACILNYLGQGAHILSDPAANVANPFFLLVPYWARIPMVVLATFATVIAAQSVVSGAFSVAYQAVQLGYLPRLRILHTSEHTMGQIYVPFLNWLLMVAVLLLVFTFESSSALAFAYGTAVTATITITTLLFFYIARQRWHKPLPLVIAGAALLLTVDLLFFAANLTKLLHGAWLPLLIGVIAFTIFMTWQQGRRIVTRQRETQEGSLRSFVDGLRANEPPHVRVSGTAVFLNRNPDSTPLAMRANVEHNHVLHEHVVILSIITVPAPHVPVDKRLAVDELGYADDGITHVRARFGYMDKANVPQLLRRLATMEIECPLEVDEATYFLSTIELRSGGRTEGLARWRVRLFLATSRITADAAEFFSLPRDRTVIMGSRIEL